jgi:hypothetical protein
MREDQQNPPNLAASRARAAPREPLTPRPHAGAAPQRLHFSGASTCSAHYVSRPLSLGLAIYGMHAWGRCRADELVASACEKTWSRGAGEIFWGGETNELDASDQVKVSAFGGNIGSSVLRRTNACSSSPVPRLHISRSHAAAWRQREPRPQNEARAATVVAALESAGWGLTLTPARADQRRSNRRARRPSRWSRPARRS